MHFKDKVAIVTGGSSGIGDISNPATEAALVESAERHFGLDKFGGGTRWPGFTTQRGGR